jgi:hypothetical protein
MMPHLLANPEVEAGFLLVALYYFGFGAFLAWVSLRDGTLELAFGAHAANNLYGAVVLSFEGSALTRLRSSTPIGSSPPTPSSNMW